MKKYVVYLFIVNILFYKYYLMIHVTWQLAEINYEQHLIAVPVSIMCQTEVHFQYYVHGLMHLTYIFATIKENKFIYIV